MKTSIRLLSLGLVMLGSLTAKAAPGAQGELLQLSAMVDRYITLSETNEQIFAQRDQEHGMLCKSLMMSEPGLTIEKCLAKLNGDLGPDATAAEKQLAAAVYLENLAGGERTDQALSQNELGADVASLGNGGTLAERAMQALRGQSAARSGSSSSARPASPVQMARSDRAASKGVAAAIHLSHPETYNQMLAMLYARYYLDPPARTAIVLLLQNISARVQGQIQAHDSDYFAKYVIDSAFLAAGVVMVLDMRYGEPNGNPQNLWEHGASFVSEVKGGFRGLRGLVQAGKAEASVSEALARVEDVEGEAIPHRVKQVEDWTAPQAQKSWFKAHIDNAKKFAPIFLNQIARGLPLAIPAGVTYGMEARSEMPKIDPMAGLEIWQMLAITQLDFDTAALNARARAAFLPYVDMNTKTLIAAKLSADAEGVRAKLADLNGGPQGFAALNAQFNHFSAFAKRFQGSLPWEDLARRVEQVHFPRFRSMLMSIPYDEQGEELIASRRDLRDLARDVVRRQRQEGKKEGIEKLSVSWFQIESRLTLIGNELRVVENEFTKSVAPRSLSPAR